MRGDFTLSVRRVCHTSTEGDFTLSVRRVCQTSTEGDFTLSVRRVCLTIRLGVSHCLSGECVTSTGEGGCSSRFLSSDCDTLTQKGMGGGG